ncbi:ParA family protein [Bacterioplanoides sp. SCSIO 12839]|uniref:ParA family protein n=1 Tax=Bacterioplanoides sp. SCSIO 12839 TaxID=2829569 RepID=UPI002102862A|nr:ParA family protein [Bacterioplanoides sp. SCSIO 12839]
MSNETSNNNSVSHNPFRPHARVVGMTAPVRVMIANAKGGCGKTTLATNVASHFAHGGELTAMIDYDPQGSSMDWLAARDVHLPTITGVAAYQKHAPQTSTKSWALRVPANTSRVVIDTPAGLAGNVLSDLIQQSDMLLIPVIPSAIDIRAATGFIRDVLLSRSYRMNPKPIAVIANRVRKNTLIYGKLEKFLNSLQIPFITALRDTQFYVRASEHGLGIVDFDQKDKKDIAEWQPLIEWIDQTIHELRQSQQASQ